LDFNFIWKPFYSLSLGLNGNLNKTTIDSIDTPEELGAINIFSHKEQGLITSVRPRSKVSLTADYQLDQFEIGIYNSSFGKVTIPHDGDQPEFDQELSSKLITDFRLSYKFTPQLQLTAIANNIFNIYPDIADPSTGVTSNGRFLYSSIVSQHGQLGRNYSLLFSYKF
jgi:iron complex outermembrane receptor protein